MNMHSNRLRSTAVVAGLATLTLTTTLAATAAAANAAQPHNEQVALVNGTGDQLEFKSRLNGTAPVASHDGRFVVFSTDAPLVAEDTNELDDVYLRDTVDDVTVLVSTVGGTLGNDYSVEPTISADGRYVAFTTWADNLTEKDTNGHTLDVVVKDLQQGTIALVSATTAGRQGKGNSFFPVISDDGRSVSFQSFSPLGPRDEDKREDVYVRDLEAGVTRQGSLLPGGNQDVRTAVINGDLSGDGSVVTFGNANNLWARNMVTGETIRFWHEPDSPPCQPFPSGSAGRPVISGDGRFAAFSSCATDLPGEDGEASDVYRVNLTSGRIVRVHPEGNGHSYLPSLSRTGRYVGFGSDANNFADGDKGGSPDAFVVDTKTGVVTRASEAPDGSNGNNWSASNDISISGDGQSLVYVSYADNLVEDDAFDLQEVFVWRR
jgi:Tol biopolymer transport system component